MTDALTPTLTPADLHAGMVVSIEYAMADGHSFPYAAGEILSIERAHHPIGWSIYMDIGYSFAGFLIPDDMGRDTLTIIEHTRLDVP